MTVSGISGFSFSKEEREVVAVGRLEQKLRRPADAEPCERRQRRVFGQPPADGGEFAETMGGHGGASLRRVRDKHGVDGGFQGIEVVLVDGPESLRIHVPIDMPKPISQIRHLTPGDLRLLRLPVLGNQPGGFTDDFKEALEGSPGNLVFAHVV